MPGPYPSPIAPALGTDSPLRRLPSNLDPRTRLPLDAMRCAIEAIALGYQRLVLEAAALGPGPAGAEAAVPFSMFVDSWTVVDWVHRLHDLVANAPGLRNSPAKELFLREVRDVDELRNAFQHVIGEYVRGTSGGVPWGSVAWVAPAGNGLMYAWTLVIGSIPGDGTIFPILNPVGKTVRGPADLFEVNAFGAHGSISGWYDAVMVFARRLEHAIANAEYHGGTPTGTVSDLLMRLEMQVDLANQNAAEELSLPSRKSLEPRR